MKYDSLKRQAVKSFRVNDFDGGLNLEKVASKVKNNELIECDNLWYEKGSLQTRPGIKAVQSSLINSLGDNSELDYMLSDIQIYLNGRYYKVAIGKKLIDDYMWNAYIQLINPNGEVISIGTISFLRTSSEIFYEPIKILIYTGKPQEGGGIFALVTKENQYSPFDKVYEIYEINRELDQWNRIYNFYTPTVYINGRGNQYQLAISEHRIEPQTPKVLESPNMLDGGFNAYFTSDGYSNVFKLPYSSLSSSTIICRIYYNLDDYTEWIIFANTTKDTKPFFNKDVVLTVNRQTGSLYFMCEGNDYAIPVMDKRLQNNIKVTATKEIDNGIGKIVDSSCLICTDSKIIVSGGENKNEIYISNYNSPLYFPQSTAVSVGGPETEISALKNIGGKIIAFKRDEIYHLSLKKNDIINQISLLSDNDKIFETYDEISVSGVLKGVGCEKKETICECGGSILFLATDNKIYALNTSGGKKAECISKKAQKLMPNYYANTFAVSNDKYYMLICGNKAVLTESVSNNEYNFYSWSWDRDNSFIGGFNKDGKHIFVSRNRSDGRFYVCSFTGEVDTYTNGDQVTKAKINSHFTTKHFDLKAFGLNKNIESFYLMLWSNGKTKISVNGREIAKIDFALSQEDFDKADFKTVKFTPHLYGADLVYLTLETDGRMSVGDLEIFYRKLG